MAQMWTTGYVFKWTPILTFSRRRLFMLEWFESNTAPVAFMDEPDSIGVALVTPELQLSITRDRMILQSSLRDAKISALEPAINGVFEIMEPQETAVHRVTSQWTCELSGDYNEERARFAASGANARVGELIGPFRPVDGATLIDLDSSEWEGQVEWGVVHARELAYRLKHPTAGQVGRKVSPAAVNLDMDDLPSVALYIDASIRRRIGGVVQGAKDVLNETQAADKLIDRTVEALHKNYSQGRGGVDELSQAR
jgi:hypothetical protein